MPVAPDGHIQRLAAAGEFQIGIIRLDGRGHHFEAVPLGVVAHLPRQRLHAVLPRLQAEFGGKSAAAFLVGQNRLRAARLENLVGQRGGKGAGGKERHNAGERERSCRLFHACPFGLCRIGCLECAWGRGFGNAGIFCRILRFDGAIWHVLWFFYTNRPSECGVQTACWLVFLKRFSQSR